MRRLVWLITLLLVGGLSFAVYALRVEAVTVTGVRTLSPRTVVQASGLRIGDRILWERLSVVQRRIEAIPAVADAVALRSLPSTVVIRVRERVPLARLDGARDLVVDADGVVFKAGDVVVPAVLYGWRGRAREGARVDARAHTVLDAFGRFPETLRARARKLHVGARFRMSLLGGTEIRFGALNDLEGKARVAEAVLRAERGTKLDYVDVRSASVPVSKKYVPPTPSAAPAAPTPTPPGTPAPTPAPAPSPQR